MLGEKKSECWTIYLICFYGRKKIAYKYTCRSVDYFWKDIKESGGNGYLWEGMGEGRR